MGTAGIRQTRSEKVGPDGRGGAPDSTGERLCGFALLPAAGWFLLTGLRWLGIAEQFRLLRWPLEETGTGLGRGFFLLVMLPGAVALYSLVTARAGARPRAAVGVGIAGFLLALGNMLTWRI